MPKFNITSPLPSLPNALKDKDASLMTPVYMAVNQLANVTSTATGNTNYTPGEMAQLSQFVNLMGQKIQRVNVLALVDLPFGILVNFVASGTKVAGRLADAALGLYANAICNSPQGIPAGTYGEVIISDGWSQGVAGTEIGKFYYLGTEGHIQDGPNTAPEVFNQYVGVGLGTAGIYFQSTIPGSYNPTYQIPKIKIAIIGDSLSAAEVLHTLKWTNVFKEIIEIIGYTVEIADVARGGTTFYKALNELGTDGKSMVQHVIDFDPDYVIALIGGVDALVGVRTLVQIKADAEAMFSALRIAMPTVDIVFYSETLYDSANFTPATAVNKGVIPFLFQFPTTGILAGCYTPEMLNTAVSAASKVILTNNAAINTYVATLPTLTAARSFSLWQVARLGCSMPDRLHPSSMGQQIIAGAIFDGFYTLPSIAVKYPLLATYGPNMNMYSQLFSTLLTPDGTGGYTVSPPSELGNGYLFELLTYRKLNPEAWIYPRKTRFAIQPAPAPNLAPMFIVENTTPNQLIYMSKDGAAFASAGVTTSDRGDGTVLLSNTTAGVLRFKVGDEIYGPVTLSDSTGPIVLTKDFSVINGALDTLFKISVASARLDIYIETYIADDLIVTDSASNVIFQVSVGTGRVDASVDSYFAEDVSVLGALTVTTPTIGVLDVGATLEELLDRVTTLETNYGLLEARVTALEP